MRLFAFALLLLATSAANAAEPRLEIEIDPATATVGDRVTVRLVLDAGDAEPGVEPQFPEWGERWGDAEIVEIAAAEAAPVATGDATWSQTLRLTAFRVGTIGLPPVAVRLGNGEVRSRPRSFEVRSVLPADDAQPAPRPPAPPRRIEVPESFWVAAAALTIAAAVAAWALGRRRAGRGTIPILTPLAELDHSLAGLVDVEVESGHVALSLAFRRFLGRVLTTTATASTTSELARILDRRGLETTLTRRAVRLLRDSDQIKFARRPASGDELRRRIGEAREIAVAIDRHLHPPVEESAA